MEDYITLGQFLKLMNIIQSGGHAKSYLENSPVLVNGEVENRRGKKLRTGDVVTVDGQNLTVE